MKFKRFMALALAGVMTLGMAMTASADVIDSKDLGFTKTVIIAKEGITKADNVEFTLSKGEPFAAAGEDKYEMPASFNEFTKTYIMDGIKSPGENAEKAQVTKTFDDIAKDMEAKMLEAGVYYFTLEESAPTTQITPSDETPYGWTKIDKTKYLIRAYAFFKEEDGKRELKYQYAVYKAGEDGKTPTGAKLNKEDIKFENVYSKIAGDPDDPNKESLKITKKIDEEGKQYADLGKKYSFSVSMTLPDGVTEATGATYKIANEEEKPFNNVTTIELADGESASFKNLPAGATIKVEEDCTSLVNFSNASFAITATRTITNEYKDKKATAEFVIGDSKNEVICTNKYAGITPTGLAISVAPFVAMFAAVGAAIALYVAAKRRVR